MKLFKHKTRKPGLLIAGVLLLVAAILFNVITPMFETSLKVAFSVSKVDEESHQNALENGYALNREIEEEGAVLLRNENGTLPLTAQRVNVFGVRSAHLVLNSAGSAAGSNTEAATLKDGLEAAGFEVNPDLWDYLAGISVKDNTAVNEGGSSEAVNEVHPASYSGAVSLKSAKSYSDIAIVTFSRLGGEGSDQTRTGMGESGEQSYLQLTANECALLESLKAEGYTVIVLINSSYPMELGVLEQYHIDAALWIGGPGVKGALAIGDLLSGKVNPSGRLVDTYAYDLTTAASYLPSDEYLVKDGEGNEIGGYTDYAESIYVGYRWYETADAEGFWQSGFARERFGVSNYEEVVQYPFGYGLSYTTFTQAYASPTYADGVFTFPVTVTNTGEREGKEVVQLYVEAPYTSGGTEKSKVVLCAFGKTGSLAPGKSETVTLTVKAEDIASYDMAAGGGAGAYVLEEGNYQFYLASGLTGAHCWANPSDSCAFEVERVEYTGENKRTSDQQAAANLLTDGEIRNGEPIRVLSRADGFANEAETAFAAYADLTVTEGMPLYEALVTLASKAGFTLARCSATCAWARRAPSPLRR